MRKIWKSIMYKFGIGYHSIHFLLHHLLCLVACVFSYGLMAILGLCLFKHFSSLLAGKSIQLGEESGE